MPSGSTGEASTWRREVRRITETSGWCIYIVHQTIKMIAAVDTIFSLIENVYSIAVLYVELCDHKHFLTAKREI